MMLLALLLAAATSKVVLLDDVVRVPRARWRTLEVSLRQRPATVECTFTVLNRSSEVRLALMTAAAAERFREGLSHRVIAATAFQRSGTLRYVLRELGDYRLVLDNRTEGRPAVVVRLQVSLLFGGAADVPIRTVDPVRRQVVIGLSAAFLLIVTLWTGRRLLSAFENRDKTPPYLSF